MFLYCPIFHIKWEGWYYDVPIVFLYCPIFHIKWEGWYYESVAVKSFTKKFGLAKIDGKKNQFWLVKFSSQRCTDTIKLHKVLDYYTIIDCHWQCITTCLKCREDDLVIIPPTCKLNNVPSCNKVLVAIIDHFINDIISIKKLQVLCMWAQTMRKKFLKKLKKISYYIYYMIIDFF